MRFSASPERMHTLCLRTSTTPIPLYRQYDMCSPYDMDQKRAQEGLAQPQAWHADDVSATPEQGEACKL